MTCSSFEVIALHSEGEYEYHIDTLYHVYEYHINTLYPFEVNMLRLINVMSGQLLL